MYNSQVDPKVLTVNYDQVVFLKTMLFWTTANHQFIANPATVSAGVLSAFLIESNCTQVFMKAVQNVEPIKTSA